MKYLIKKNGPVIGGGLDSLVSALNNRISSIPQAGSSSMRFFGWELRLGLPGLGAPVSAERRTQMQDAMRQNRQRYGKSLASHTSILYELGQQVLVFSPKIGLFSENGVIESWVPTDDLLGPRNFTVRMDSGPLRKVNSSWLSPFPGQNPPWDQNNV